ncbi:hypothetical protein N7478_006522 [Penicillium angulare]|uniref:uncharacterized protein n=1 Tax=Penicillium angulare TaxID=116970 RepID=UPI002540151F|nr:uncharacterized protein N7478_006522 [Penicillium angulare]KAJ5281150.1 hypothetical protein N7478_006522 [Penicillium angulare]
MHYRPQDEDEDDYEEPQRPQRPPPAARALNRQSRAPQGPPIPKGQAIPSIRSYHGNQFKTFEPRRFKWN